MLIAFEGIDNVGKSTQIRMLADRLDHAGLQPVISNAFDSTVASLARSQFTKASPAVKSLLFAADRHQRLEDVVGPALASGRVVLLDRWTLSTEAYRAAEDFPIDYVRNVNALLPKPDCILLFELDPEEAWHRGEAIGDFPPYRRDFMSKVAVAFRRLAPVGTVIVDASPPAEDVAEVVAQTVFSRVAASGT